MAGRMDLVFQTQGSGSKFRAKWLGLGAIPPQGPVEDTYSKSTSCHPSFCQGQETEKELEQWEQETPPAKTWSVQLWVVQCLAPMRFQPHPSDLTVGPTTLNGPASHGLTTSVLTAAMTAYTLGAGITATAGTRLALQWLLITVFGLHPFQAVPTGEVMHSCCSSLLPQWTCSFMGQFACLLPTVAVVAVSEAPSPESDPHSPLPVEATVIQYITTELIGQKFA